MGLVLGLLAIGLVGCGEPIPDSTPSSGPTPSSSRLPARPAELQISGVDPCALLTPTQEHQLGVERGHPSSGGDEFNSPVCLWDNLGGLGGRPDNGWLIRLISQRGADYALDSVEPTHVVRVDGFPAIQTSSAGQDPRTHCILLVDIAQGQSMWIQYVNGLGNYPGISHEVACGLARDVAQMAVGNLRTLAK